MDAAFETLRAGGSVRCRSTSRRAIPKAAADSDAVHRAAIRAKALDTLRGMLPAATQSNVGIYGTGQAFEALLLRMRAHPLAEVRDCADADADRAAQGDPGLPGPRRSARARRHVERVPRRDARRQTAALAAELVGDAVAEPRPEVTLTDFDPDGEVKIVAAALYAVSDLPDDQLLAIARRMTADDRVALLRAYVGERANRRHRPGRAFERTTYRFDVLTDYGAFRDLQRHRLLTLEWQPLTPRHGYIEPDAIARGRRARRLARVMDASAELLRRAARGRTARVAPYAVAMAYRVRFYMEMNAREAMHVIELRTAPQGHPAYRRVCQQMHDADRDAGRASRHRRRRCSSPITPRSSSSDSAPSARSNGSALMPRPSTVFAAPVAAELVEERQRLEGPHPIEEQHAVEVIGLVLDDARGEATGFQLDPLAACDRRRGR